jgi:hypothetical protein
MFTEKSGAFDKTVGLNVETTASQNGAWITKEK